jgi:hypothetical protein
MTWLLYAWFTSLGLAGGAVIERYRWVSWAWRNHPEEAEAEGLRVL